MRLPAIAASLMLWSLYAAPATVKFNRDIRPIMSDTCFRCHGPDAKSRMANLRLDVRDEALKKTRSGVTPIVPGDPAKSAIIARIFATDAKIMPPQYAHKELTPAQKETVKRWIAEGAEYEGHWSWQPVKRPAVPQPADAKYIRNPVDAFIQDRLARAGLQPSPEADKRTLLRRVTFDLTGLPPTPEETDAFLKDTAPDAYEKVVDRLMASPHYAETRAMHWLDAVRYADSSGFHGDNLWPAWPYRDWVLKAIASNMPFDQFTREQLAGDLLPDATIDQKIASAYNRMNRVSAEGGLQPKEYLAKYGADRVRTTTTVWLGATMGCAECHDHKFDPFTARDFYSFKAFFSDIRETGLVPDRGPRAWGAKLVLATPEQKTKLAAMDEKLTELRKALAAKIKAREEQRWAWEEKLLARHGKGELAWKYQRPLSAEAKNGTKLTIYNDEALDYSFYLNGSLFTEHKRGEGLVVASGPNPDNDTYTVKFKPGQGSWTAFGLDVHQDETLPGNRMARGANGPVLSEVEILVDGQKVPLVLANSAQFGELADTGAMAAIDGDTKTGWSVTYVEARSPFLALRFGKRIETTANSEITIRLAHESQWRHANLGRFRLALSSAEYSAPEGGESSRKMKVKRDDAEAATLNTPVDNGIPLDVLTALRKPEEERTEAESALVADFYAWSTPELQNDVIGIAKADIQRGIFDATIPRILATERARPRVTRVLARGNFLDESGAIVQPAIPAVFGKLDTGDRHATRLDLANWIISKDNPLTPRVFVNRIWRQFFGIGLSKVMEDLGSQGEWPTHPELLDWLAAEFQSNWDMKNIVRTVVTSHTYRQSSLSNATIDAKDLDNRLLARQNRFRIEPESIHDTALKIAGLLNEGTGGPSVRPPEPEGYLAAMNFSKRDYSASHGDDQYRRALYTQWQRTFLHPTLLTLDAPTREECTVNRVLSNTPLQALVLLNDPIFIEAARKFAERIVTQGGTKLDEQLDFAFRQALQRTPTKEERKILTDLHKRAALEYKTSPAEAKQLLAIGEAPAANDKASDIAAMTAVARTILNLHETITRN